MTAEQAEEEAELRNRIVRGEASRSERERVRRVARIHPGTGLLQLQGGYWKWINLSGIDLTRFAIYNEFNQSNYHHNC